MSTAIFQRILYGIVLILAVVVLDFLLIQAAPGDVVDTILTEAGGGDPALAASIRASYGLDKPIPVQLLKYLGKMLTGDLGFSYYYDDTVLSLLLSHLPATLMLTLSAFVIAVFLGTLMGVIAALRPRHPTERRWWSKAAYNSHVIPDQISLGSQLQNLPQTNLAYTKPEIRPRVSMVKPAIIHAYPVESSSSSDGRRLKKNP